MTFRLTLAIGLWLVSVGCGQRFNDQAVGVDTGAPTAQLVSETQLVESEVAFIGRAASFAVSPGGRFAVGDGASSHVFVYGPTGTHIGTVSKKGKGPGELWTPNYLGFTSDSTLAVVDLSLRRLTTFRVRGDSFATVASVNYEGDANIVTGLAEGEVLLGLREARAGTALARWHLGEQAVRPLVRAPVEIVQNSVVASGLFQAYPVQMVDGALVAFAATPYVVVFDSAYRQARDTLWVPALRRRGLALDLEARLKAAFPDVSKAMSQFSTLQAVGVLQNGMVGLAHLDATGRGRRIFNRAAWVSLLDVNRRIACVDGRIEVG
ncbi:MAG: hypothetical protein Q8K82_14430, partial [Gemmatimonadaceae bacterium]|nr:hypothetical protein [Gemmatimonadaceae bacterium]